MSIRNDTIEEIDIIKFIGRGNGDRVRVWW